ncbi:hypothetical protein CJ030_MR2G028802 [Morella rubra]|uniref:Uncharacterized protein n=1 Tax=Morella rubra TaxID=262757 RepID=A0A6A1W9Z2_9ROSI|nr:hypothetical protein CJ030_MR2G028802 [Morella rubra]
MGSSKLTRLLLQEISRRKCVGIVLERTAPKDLSRPGALHERRYSNLSASLEKELFEADHLKEESSSVCIYKVPAVMRGVERKAFQPSIMSIGPYHHGVERLQVQEELKRKFVGRLFDQSRENGVKFEIVKSAMGKLEEEARICYSEEIDLKSEEFVNMMLVDGCFIVELFREVWQQGLEHQIPFIKRWMLPVLRRDFIMLENQLPLFVLNKLFQMTSSGAPAEPLPSLQNLALHFFNPLLQRDFDTRPTEGASDARHVLDLFRSTILPVGVVRRKQPKMIPSMTELKEAGIKVQKARYPRLLDITCEEKVLKIPPLYLDDRKCTLFRNMVAFEKCHRSCHPDVTTYLFFFDALINSAKDVGLLHYNEVLHHSLGSNKEVARLVSKVCKEIDRDVDESYLFFVVHDANSFCNSFWAKKRAALARHYFSSWGVGVSTIGALFALYLTLIQTTTGVAGSLTQLKGNYFGSFLTDSLLLPLFGKPRSGGGD